MAEMTSGGSGGTGKKGVSIKWKIFLFLLGFCLLLLVILWLFQTVLLGQFYTYIKLNQVEKETASLATLVEQGQTEALENAVRARGDLYVELIDSSGESQMVQGFFPEFSMGSGDNEHRVALYNETVANGGSLTQRYEAELPGDLPGTQPMDGQKPPGDEPGKKHFPGDAGRWGAESILHARLVTTPGGEELLLLVRAAITPVNATVETLRTQLLFISLIMVVLAVGIALLIAKRVAKPIEKLNTAAGELARGNYEVSFEGKGYREVGQLAGTLNHAAAELAKTEELRRDLIANVSHDLRTPLTLITGYAEMMRDIPGENTPENMQVIVDEARRLSTLVGDLLDLSQLQSGVSKPLLERFDLTAEVEDIIGRFAKFSEPEGFTVCFEHPESPVYVQADSRRIGQVVYNFLINAMTHGGQEKTITLRLFTSQGLARLEVSDTGEGIPAEQLPYIWDRYYKVDKVHKRAAAGAGLGLSIVKSILEQHPGIRYGVQSAPGIGSTFWFSLPVEG